MLNPWSNRGELELELEKSQLWLQLGNYSNSQDMNMEQQLTCFGYVKGLGFGLPKCMEVHLENKKQGFVFKCLQVYVLKS